MLNEREQIRLDYLKTKDPATTTASEKREITDLTADLGLKENPVIAYQETVLGLFISLTL